MPRNHMDVHVRMMGSLSKLRYISLRAAEDRLKRLGHTLDEGSKLGSLIVRQVCHGRLVAPKHQNQPTFDPCPERVG